MAKKLQKIFIAAAQFATCFATAGPMGLSQGMTLLELNKLGGFAPVGQPFVYKTETLTTGHPDFEFYAVIVTPEEGLCKIEAAGKNIDSSPDGSEIQEKFNNLVDRMTGQYGPPGKTFNFLDTESPRQEPKDWMSGLRKKERTLSAFWAPPYNPSLPDYLHTIMLEAVALSQTRGYIKIGFEFKNFSRCLEAIKMEMKKQN